MSTQTELPAEVSTRTLTEQLGWLDSAEACLCFPSSRTRSRIRKRIKERVGANAKIATAAQSVASDGKAAAPRPDAPSLTMELCSALASYGWAADGAAFLEAEGSVADSLTKNVSTLRARGVCPPVPDFDANRWRICPACGGREVPSVSGGVPVSGSWRRGTKRRKAKRAWCCVDCHQGGVGGADKKLTDWSNTPRREYTTASPSAAVIQNLARRQKDGRGARLEQAQLASASEKTLLAEIAYFNATGAISGTASD